jgi:hypothetical protein
MAFDEFGQALAHNRAARASENVANEKNTHRLDGNTLNRTHF